MDHFHRLYHTVKRRHPQLEITVGWVPGHEGVEGNEAADEEAKRAATEGSSPKDELPAVFRKVLPKSRSAAKKTYTKELHRAHDSMFGRSPRHQSFGKVAKGEATALAHRFQQMTAGLPKPLTSMLVQLRTGHNQLSHHLHCIGKIDSPTCPCCNHDDKTAFHYLLRCPAHRGARASLRGAVGRKNLTMNGLLDNEKSLEALFQFVNDTRRFQHIFGTLPPMEKEDDEEQA